MTDKPTPSAVESHTVTPRSCGDNPAYEGDGPIVKPKKKKVGRPSAMTDDVLRKLLEARADGASIEQACNIANINPSSYYDYVLEHQEFSESMDRAKDIISVLATRKLKTALDSKEFTLEKQMEIAWKILDREDRREARRLMPSRQGGNINLNLGTQNLIKAEDLTDEQCQRLARGEAIEEVLGNSQLASAPKDE